MPPENGDALDALEQHVTAALEQAIERLNHMREEEGRGAVAELRNRMTHLSSATQEVDQLRGQSASGLSGKGAQGACRSC